MPGKFRLSDMELDFVSLVASGDDPMAQVVLAKAEDKSGEEAVDASIVPGNDLLEDTVTDTVSKDDLDPEVVQYIDALEAEVETLGAQVEKAEADLAAKDEQIAKMAPKDADSATEIRKAALEKADPAIRALIEKQDEEIAKAHAVAKAERDARLEREYISKAEALPMLTESPAALADVLRSAADALTPEQNTVLNTVLKAANEQITKSNLFSTMGTGGGETTVSKSVEAAKAEIKKSQPTLTDAQAEALAYDQNPALLAQAMTGQEN